LAPIPFTCELVREDRHVRVCPHGELDLSSAPILDQRLREALDGGRRLLVDLRGLDFMDSTGLTLLVRWGRGAESDGYELALVRGDAHIHRLFELTGLDTRFAFVAG
jgi:anti-sigma B factor antagonist